MNLFKSKRQILNRYERLDTGEYCVDITAKRVEELYHDFDKQSPYSKKELDEDVAEYVIESAEELGNSKVVIRIFLTELPNERLIERVTKSFHNYFLYRRALVHREMHSMRRTAIYHTGLGFLFLILSILTEKYFILHFWNDVLAEGINVAAWVVLWNALAIYLVNRKPLMEKLKLFNLLSSSPILFVGEKAK